MENSRSSSLSTIYKCRKQAEREAQQLANRIKLLQLEDNKSLRKIQEMKRKSSEIVKKQENNMEKQAIKSMLFTERQKEREELRIKCQKLKEVRRNEKFKLRDAILNKRKEEALAIRKESQEFRQKQSELKDSIYSERKSLHFRIQQHKSQSTQKIRSLRNNSEQIGKHNYRLKIEIENSLLKVRENDITKLELIELEMIHKLQNTQRMQAQEFKKLQRLATKRNFKYTLHLYNIYFPPNIYNIYKIPYSNSF